MKKKYLFGLRGYYLNMKIASFWFCQDLHSKAATKRVQSKSCFKK